MLIAHTTLGRAPLGLRAAMERAADAGFDGLAVLPGERPDWTPDAEKQARPSGLSLPVLAWDALIHEDEASTLTPEWVAWSSHDLARQRQAIARVPAALAQLRRLGADTLILDPGGVQEPQAEARSSAAQARLREGLLLPGIEAMENTPDLAEIRERQWEAIARFLHGIHRQAPGLNLAVITPQEANGVLDPAALTLLREDAGLPWLAYWHDCGRAESRAALGLEGAGDWLDRHASKMVGCTLNDWADGRDLLLPGEGIVDFRLLGEYLPRNAHRVLSVAPVYPMEAWSSGLGALASFGIA